MKGVTDFSHLKVGCKHSPYLNRWFALILTMPRNYLIMPWYPGLRKVESTEFLKSDRTEYMFDIIKTGCMETGLIACPH